MIFTLFFVIFAVTRAGHIDLFTESQMHLNQNFGALNTFIMLTSSLFVAVAVRAARARNAEVARAAFIFAGVLGLAFVLVKAFEWGEKVRAGITLNTNSFFTLYYMLTGMHLLHVIVGLSVLFVLIRYTRSGNFDAKKISYIESGASFWHLVDLLWIVLFPIIYLIK